MSEREWWRDAVVYQIYLRSFADGNGDGIGDVAGLRSRLEYLVDLGVDAIWITPWYPSPGADAGYDVSDYRDLDPAAGTLDEARTLIDECHRIGLRVLLDVVPNHTSEAHPWFVEAVASPPGSAARERYVFRPGRGPDGAEPPTNWLSTFGGSTWTRVPDGEWYLHLFTPEQPDLNWANPEVRAEFADVLRFWFDLGFDGMRIDVANGLVKDPAYPDVADPAAFRPPYWVGHPAGDQEGVHEIWREWRKVADGFTPPRVLTGEVWVTPPDRLARYVRPDELHTVFNFDFLIAGWDAAAYRRAIDDALTTMAAVGAPPTWVLSNHDTVRHATRFGRPAGREYDPAGAVPADRALGLRRARAAALLQLALPGSAYLYQGDELGLPEVEDLPSAALRDPRWERSGRTDRGRDGARIPLPWSGDAPPFGFGGADTWLPQPADWAGLTVAAQVDDPASTLELYRAALETRRAEFALGDGTLTWLDTPAGSLGFTRYPGFACIVNCAADPVPLPAHGGVILASGPLPVRGELPPDTAVWLRWTS